MIDLERTMSSERLKYFVERVGGRVRELLTLSQRSGSLFLDREQCLHLEQYCFFKVGKLIETFSCFFKCEYVFYTKVSFSLKKKKKLRTREEHAISGNIQQRNVHSNSLCNARDVVPLELEALREVNKALFGLGEGAKGAGLAFSLCLESSFA